MPQQPQVDWSSAQPVNQQVDWGSATPIASSAQTDDHPQEGMAQSFMSQMGLPTHIPSMAEVGKMLFDPREGPGMGVVRGAERSGGEIGQAYQMAKQHNPAGVAEHIIKAIPFVGPAMDKASDQYADQNYGGELGTLGAADLQVAPAIEMASAGGHFIPSMARAGDALQGIKAEVGNAPVSLTRSAPILQRLAELSERGGAGKVPSGVMQMLQRSQETFPMEYPEANDYASNISRLSREEAEKVRSVPQVASQLRQLKSAFRGDIGDTASQFGRGEDYAKAIKEYAQAARLKGLVQSAGKMAARSAVPAAGAGGAYELYKMAKGQ